MPYTFTLTTRFYDDTKHCHCFYNDPIEHKRTKTTVTVTLTSDDAAELYSRAQSYADGENAREYRREGYGGLVSSAGTTIKRMLAQGYDLEDYKRVMAEQRAEYLARLAEHKARQAAA